MKHPLLSSKVEACEVATADLTLLRLVAATFEIS